MESKVILYDANGVKIGATFVRRARQLVKQQRASWVNDGQEAIRFAPGMEHLDDTPMGDVHEGFATEGVDAALMKIAKRRVYARFAFNLHLAIAVSIVCVLVFIYMLTDRGGYFWPIWPMLGLGISLVIHGVVNKLANSSEMEDKIAMEYEQLKNRYQP